MCERRCSSLMGWQYSDVSSFCQNGFQSSPMGKKPSMSTPDYEERRRCNRQLTSRWIRNKTPACCGRCALHNDFAPNSVLGLLACGFEHLLAWDNSVGVIWRESWHISMYDNSWRDYLLCNSGDVLGSFAGSLSSGAGRGCTWAACGWGALPSLCRAALGVRGRRISPCGHPPLALESRLGRLAAKELAGSKDCRSTFICTRPVY